MGETVSVCSVDNPWTQIRSHRKIENLEVRGDEPLCSECRPEIEKSRRSDGLQPNSGPTDDVETS